MSSSVFPGRLERLDILFIGRVPPHRGGSGVLNGEIVRGCLEAGHRVRVVAPIVATGPQGVGPQQVGYDDDYHVHRYTLPRHASFPADAVGGDYHELEKSRVRRLASALIRDRTPDLVLLGSESYASHAPDLTLARGLPTALIVHAHPDFYFSSASEHWRRGLMENLRRLKLIVAVGDNQAWHWRQLGLDNVALIPSAVDSAMFAPGPKDTALEAALDIPRSSTVVAHVSNLKSAKRPMDIVLSAEIALKRHPSLVYLIIGDGPARTNLEQECRRRNLLSHFRFAGWVPHDQVARYLRLADLVVMPSSTEACPLAHLEAMACGMALVATDIPASRELLTDGQSVLLFPVGDIAKLAELTLRMARDVALRSALGGAALRVSRSRSFDAMIRSYMRAFDAVARRYGFGRPQEMQANAGTRCRVHPVLGHDALQQKLAQCRVLPPPTPSSI